MKKDCTENATARPWIISNEEKESFGTLLIRTNLKTMFGDVVARVIFTTQERMEANAALIVRAVNSHAALVEALEAARKLLSEPDSGGYCVAPDSVIFTQINAALKLAKGEA